MWSTIHILIHSYADGNRASLTVQGGGHLDLTRFWPNRHRILISCSEAWVRRDRYGASIHSWICNCRQSSRKAALARRFAPLFALSLTCHLCARLCRSSDLKTGGPLRGS